MAQRYKNGLVIQETDSNISAFMERKEITVNGTVEIESNYPAGIGSIKIIAEGGRAGEPIAVDTLPEATEDLVGKIYFVTTDSKYFMCLPEEEGYAWKELIIGE